MSILDGVSTDFVFGLSPPSDAQTLELGMVKVMLVTQLSTAPTSPPGGGVGGQVHSLVVGGLGCPPGGC